MSPRIARGAAAAAGALSLLALTWCGGRSSGAASARAAVADSIRDTFADSSAAIERRLAARAPVIAHTDSVARVARAASAAATARIAIVDDSTVRVDSGPPVHEVPATIAIPAIRTCTQAIAADTVELHAVAAQLLDMTHDRDVWKSRATLDEASSPHATRFGFRSGLVAGAGLLALVLHFVR